MDYRSPRFPSRCLRCSAHLAASAGERGWSFGRPIVIRHCRVGVLNELGECLSAHVYVLLIGERPGLATAESLSAYLAYQSHAGHTDAERNLVSNIHARGLSIAEAAQASRRDGRSHASSTTERGPAQS